MTIKFDLHYDGNNLVLDPQDIYKFLSENTSRELDLAYYLSKWTELLNYPLSHNTEMAFDDGYYKELYGWINGFSYAHHIEINEVGSVVRIIWGRYKIDMPKPFTI